MNDENVKIGKKTSVSLEFVLVCFSAVLVLGGIWLNLNNHIQVNDSNICNLQTQMKGLESTLEKINSTLGEMLLESRIQSGISRIRSSDLWSASMQEASQKRWRVLIRKRFPDIDDDEFPKTKWIQTTYSEDL